MKLHLSLAILLFTSMAAFAQKPDETLPANLKKAAAPLMGTYPKVEAKKAPKAPADSVWIFRGADPATGTVEVGFQHTAIVYMVFRRGTGGTGWKIGEIARLHEAYSHKLLKEGSYMSKYDHSVATAISAGVITRKDFDPKILNSAF